MKDFETFRTSIPDYAKDVKLNLSSILSEQTSDGLSKQQIYGVALASAYITRQPNLIRVIDDYVKDALSETERNAAKSAATIMAMNNVYYRFVHLVNDKEYQQMPARLRMNIIANPGIDKFDFELYSLAVSAINGCGLCIDAHVAQLRKSGGSKAAVQQAIRIAAVINSAAQVVHLEEIAVE